MQPSEKLRAEEPLNAKEKTIHGQGLVTVLKQIHDDLDAAVFDAYGWPADLGDDDILRWLRPEYQAPDAVPPEQTQIAEPETAPEAAPVPFEKRTWPKELKEQVAAVQSAPSAVAEPVGLPAIAAAFGGRRTRKRLDRIRAILDMLADMGRVQEEDEKYMAG